MGGYLPEIFAVLFLKAVFHLSGHLKQLYVNAALNRPVLESYLL